MPISSKLLHGFAPCDWIALAIPWGGSVFDAVYSDHRSWRVPMLVVWRRIFHSAALRVLSN